MDLKKLLSAKNVVVGSIVTVAAILSSIQVIRDNVARLLPSGGPATAIQWDTTEDNRATGRLTLDFYWTGTRDKDAPVVRSSRVEGARRISSNDSILFDAGQRLGRDKWPVTLQRGRSGRFWQDVKITIQTDRLGMTQIYLPQEEANNGDILWRVLTAKSSGRDLGIAVQWRAPVNDSTARPPQITRAEISGARRKSDRRTRLLDAGVTLSQKPVTVTLERVKQTDGEWQDIAGVIESDLCPPETLFVPAARIGGPPVRAESPPPAEKPAEKPGTNPVRDALEEAAMRELDKILGNTGTKGRILGLQEFVRDPKWAGTAAQKRALQELQKMFGG